MVADSILTWSQKSAAPLCPQHLLGASESKASVIWIKKFDYDSKFEGPGLKPSSLASKVKMDGTTRLKIGELNKNLICTLCGGYFVDATTIIECLHSFCRTCIVTYLRTSKTCPTCDTVVHKTRPHQNIRSDLLLQDLVYKLVPGLYKDEMKRRREFYTNHYDAAPKRPGEERGDEMSDRFAYTEEENISLALYLLPDGGEESQGFRRVFSSKEVLQSRMERRIKGAVDIRYLQCKAAVTVGLLKKFVHLKYGLPRHFEVEMFYNDESLRDSSTLCDVAYTFNWRRRSPMALTFCVCVTPPSKSKPTRLATELNSIKDKTEKAQATKENQQKSIPKLEEIIDILENDMVKNEINLLDFNSPADAQKIEEAQDIVKMETETSLENETETPDSSSAPAAALPAILKTSILTNTEKIESSNNLKDIPETNAKSVKQKLSGKISKMMSKTESNKCNKSPLNGVYPPTKKVKIETKAELTGSQNLPKPLCMLHSTAVNNMDNKLNCQSLTPITLSSSQPDITSSFTGNAAVTNNNTKEKKPLEHDKITTKSSHQKPEKESFPIMGPSKQASSSISSIPDHFSKFKTPRSSKSILGKRPAANPVLIAPAPAKIPSLSPTVVDISQMIKVENTQPSLNNINSSISLSSNSNTNHNQTSFSLVPVLPVGLPTPSPTPKKLAVPRLPKTSKSSKKLSSFTVAHLLGSPTPKRTRVRMTPSSVARIKPPVLNFINTSTTSSATPACRESILRSSVPATLQTPYIPNPAGFMSSVVFSQSQLLPQPQLFLSSNGVSPAGIRLSGLNPSALCGSQIIPTSSLTTKSSSSIAMSFPSIGVSSTLPSLTNLPLTQSAFFSSKLTSVSTSQLFSSVPTSVSVPFCFPVISSSSISVSPFAVTSSISVSSSSSASSTSSSLVGSLSSTTTSSSASVTTMSQIKTLVGTKRNLSIPTTSLSSPPPAASASPTPAAVPVQQSQTQGADSGFVPSSTKDTQVTPTTQVKATSISSKGVCVGQKSKAKTPASYNFTKKNGSKLNALVASRINSNGHIACSQNGLKGLKSTSAFDQTSKIRFSGMSDCLSNVALTDSRYSIQVSASSSVHTENKMVFSGLKKAKPKNLIVSKALPCTSSSINTVTSPNAPSSTNSIYSKATNNKSSVSPASALAQLCITSPTFQSVSSTSSSIAASFTFPPKASPASEESASKNISLKNISSGPGKDSNCVQHKLGAASGGKKYINGMPAALEKTSIAEDNSPKTSTLSPTSPLGRSNICKPKKKIADIANTLHKRVSESLNAQSSSSSPQDRTPISLGNRTFISSTLLKSNEISCAWKSSILELQRSNGGGMILPVTKPASSSSSSIPALENKAMESVRDTKPTSTITCARHELPGRPLSLQNAPLAKGLSTYMASKAEAKRTVVPAAVVRSSTPITVSSTGYNDHQVEEQPLNLVKRDGNFSCASNSLLVSDVSHAVK
ncbi:polycomb complex protein bmi-1 [Plakobranchus ocellatus]|uniref:Polycomb complex protein bmi-1 n=1 Tax=Plakobranchus ocellatus TaxID=259542 RepID=A0AAV4BZ98_9GAST|nr:polycomb complex protein bmi-1 [Plakobranchus ocellatus]